MLVLSERYRDASALDVHRAASHYHELLVERILPLLTAGVPAREMPATVAPHGAT